MGCCRSTSSDHGMLAFLNGAFPDGLVGRVCVGVQLFDSMERAFAKE